MVHFHVNILHTCTLFLRLAAHKLCNKHFHHRPIYLIILQVIIRSPLFKNYLHLYIYSLEIFSLYYSEHIQIWWCSWSNFNVQLQPLFNKCSNNTCIVPQFVATNVIFLYSLVVDLLFLLTIIHVSWFQGQPYHSTIHQLF
jgi:hypothetical protein